MVVLLLVCCGDGDLVVVSVVMWGLNYESGLKR